MNVESTSMNTTTESKIPIPPTSLKQSSSTSSSLPRYHVRHSRYSPARRLAISLLVFLVILVFLGWITRRWTAGDVPTAQGLTAVAVRTNLEVAITAGGELESSKTVTVVSEVQGQQVKIVELIPDGT